MALLSGLKTRIETVHFEESIKFYSKVLGMTILQSWDENRDRGTILGFDSGIEGDAFLEIALVEDAIDYGGLSLQFRVSDISIFAANLRGFVDYEGPDQRPWGSTYLYLKDPSGIRVIVLRENCKAEYF